MRRPPLSQHQRVQFGSGVSATKKCPLLSAYLFGSQLFSNKKYNERQNEDVGVAAGLVVVWPMTRLAVVY